MLGPPHWDRRTHSPSLSQLVTRWRQSPWSQSSPWGLDGSRESLAAAHWAADEAERRKLTLRLLHAWPLLVPEPTNIPSEMDQNYWAERIVHNTRAELQARHPGLKVVGNLVADDAQDALLQAASESEMLVLGSRGLPAVESSPCPA